MQSVSHRTLGVGVFLALLSNLLFASFYPYSGWLAPLSGTDVFVWRVVLMCAVIFLYLLLSGQWSVILADLRSYAKKKQLIWLVAPTPIMLSQMWLFMWAPLNGEGVAVAMGYFLLPLVLVLVGCWLGEQLAGLQKLAVLLAGIGVGAEILQGGSLSWATFWVCLTYPVYYVVRRKQGVRAVTGLFVDTLVFLPIGLVLLVIKPSLTTQIGGVLMMAKVVGLGALSVAAFLANLQAMRMLPMSLFGMLSYLEPLLLFVVAITLLGEPVTGQMLFSYGFIWLGIVCLLMQGVVASRKKYGR
ncbi:MAG: EamA family transporter RarD [Moraxella sp.]|nr:EamA family transporter RarD [Moraxella sp.]